MIPKQICVGLKLDGANQRVKESYDTVFSFAHQNNIPLYILPDNRILHSVPTLLISIGGDGTMLYVAKESLKFDNSAVIGINAGNLGFLTDTYDKIALQAFLTTAITVDLDFVGNPINDRTGGVLTITSEPHLSIDERMVLEAETPDGKRHLAINEFLLAPNSLNAPFKYDIFVNGQPLASHSASGLIVATPTGSTAYSLSAGGAIINPTAKVMQIVPVSAHSLTARPVVLSGLKDEVVVVVSITDRVKEVQLVSDGQEKDQFRLNGKAYKVRIKRFEKSVKILRPIGWSFFGTLTEKMNWR